MPAASLRLSQVRFLGCQGENLPMRDVSSSRSITDALSLASQRGQHFAGGCNPLWKCVGLRESTLFNGFPSLRMLPNLLERFATSPLLNRGAWYWLSVMPFLLQILEQQYCAMPRDGWSSRLEEAISDAYLLRSWNSQRHPFGNRRG